MLTTQSEPQEVIRQATPLLIVVHNAFEMAAIRALEFFTPRGRGRKPIVDPALVNSSLYSALVRYYVMRALNEKGFDTHEEDLQGIDPKDIPYDIDNLPNNGLSVEIRRVRVPYTEALLWAPAKSSNAGYARFLPAIAAF